MLHFDFLWNLFPLIGPGKMDISDRGGKFPVDWHLVGGNVYHTQVFEVVLLQRDHIEAQLLEGQAHFSRCDPGGKTRDLVVVQGFDGPVGVDPLCIILVEELPVVDQLTVSGSEVDSFASLEKAKISITTTVFAGQVCQAKV